MPCYTLHIFLTKLKVTTPNHKGVVTFFCSTNYNNIFKFIKSNLIRNGIFNLVLADLLQVPFFVLRTFLLQYGRPHCRSPPLLTFETKIKIQKTEE